MAKEEKKPAAADEGAAMPERSAVPFETGEETAAADVLESPATDVGIGPETAAESAKDAESE